MGHVAAEVPDDGGQCQGLSLGSGSVCQAKSHDPWTFHIYLQALGLIGQMQVAVMLRPAQYTADSETSDVQGVE